MSNQTFLTIKEASQLFNKSELTIRRLVKQHIGSEYVRSEDTPKGNVYQISQDFLQQHYSFVPLAVSVPTQGPDLQQENAQLRMLLAERDTTIQQQQNQIFEQRDVINALINQMNSQKIGHIEELLLQQNEQLNELQKRLPADNEQPNNRKTFWQRLFGS
ncbi:hypothetical protein [Spirosoma panaciterrae]|uniref:hypothetical protein n=1 Tax=Spirosoma panaciterrae TaxID=496058 RepID=UPI0004780029|nr:hypothetical protein [Spirosoma panaciterrae]